MPDRRLRLLQRQAAQGDPEARRRLRLQLVRGGAGEDEAGLCIVCRLMSLPESGACARCDLGIDALVTLPSPWLTVHQAALALAVSAEYVERLGDAGHLRPASPVELGGDELLAILLDAGEWYRADWPEEAQELTEVLARRRLHGRPAAPEQLAQAAAFVPGEYVYRREDVGQLALALPVPFRCRTCGGEEVGLRGWRRACCACAARGRWVRLTEIPGASAAAASNQAERDVCRPLTKGESP